MTTYADVLDRVLARPRAARARARLSGGRWSGRFGDCNWPNLATYGATDAASKIGLSLVLRARQPLGELAARVGMKSSDLVPALTRLRATHAFLDDCILLRSPIGQRSIRLRDVGDGESGKDWHEVVVDPAERTDFAERVLDLLG